MNVRKTLGFAAIAVASLSACKNKDQFPGYEKSATGLYSKFFITNPTARKPKTGEYAAISVTYYSGKDSLIFNSHSIKESDNGIISQPVFNPTFKGGFEEALLSMAEGDSASFKISADSIYKKTFGLKELPKFIEKGSMLTFYVKLHKVKTQQELVNEMAVKDAPKKEAEMQQLEEYVKQNNITVKPTESGLYYIEKSSGKGPLITAGQTVSVKYTGKFLDGKVFDSSDLHGGKPFDLPAGKGQVIRGWDEALLKMKKGTKATIIIPSSLGYGPQASGPIPAFSTLMFDIEVVDVK